MLDIVDPKQKSQRGHQAPPARRAWQPLGHVPHGLWQGLADAALEPNAFYLPDWTRAVSASARERTGGACLLAFDDQSRLTAMMPFIPAGRAYRLPLPALVSFDAYAALGTPLLSMDQPARAAARLIDAAREMGARALVLRDLPLDGPVFATLSAALARQNLAPRILHRHYRAVLDATQEAEPLLRDSLGAKKLKELRRQRARLAELGEVAFHVVREEAAIPRALNDFLLLEASGWKAARGTALSQHAGDTAFIRFAVTALARQGACEIVSLTCGQVPVAAGIVLRHHDRAFWFKIGVDPAFARHSPGVQLALDLTRHLCADPAIRLADSNAIAGHPMIDPLWRGRMAVGDVLLPLYRRDPAIAALHGALVLRHEARALARPLVTTLRRWRASLQGKSA